MGIHDGVKKVGRRLVLGFDYSHQRVEESKLLGASKYDAQTKTRSYSYHSAPQLVEFCEKYDLPVSDEVYEIAANAENLPEIEMYREGVRIRVGPGPTLPDSIPTGKSGDWIYVASVHAKDVVRWGRKYNKRISSELLDYVKTQFQEETENYQLGTALTAPEREITGLLTTPIPEQWVPVNIALRSHKFLLADEQGLGKTLESLMVARITGHESKRMIIVCPDRMAETWVVEMQTHFEEGTFTPWIATSRTPKDIPEDTDVVVIGWAVVGHWADLLIKWKPDMVVADEGHYAKAGKVVTKTESQVDFDETGNITVKDVKKKVGGSQRSNAIISIFGSLGATDKAMLLTGTPIPNRPNELLPILQALKIEGFFGGSHLFKMRYCDGKQKYIGAGKGIGGSGYVWDFSGASNLIELNSRLLSSGHYVRRTKKHLVEAGRLPKKIVDGVEFYDQTSDPVPTMIQGDPDIMKEYLELEYGLSKELSEFAKTYAKQIGAGVNSARVLKKVAAEGQKQKENLFQLRRLAGMAAVPAVKEIVQRKLDQGEKVLLIAHHRDVVNAYAETFEGAVKIQGAMSPKEVEKNKALFNAAGFDHPVMVLALEAGKTGHTLCKQPDQTCATTIFAEQAWNPADDHQAQDRIWRLGQNREVKITNVIVEDTVNKDIYDKRRNKRKIIDAAVDSISDLTETDDKAWAGEMAIELARRGLDQ